MFTLTPCNPKYIYHCSLPLMLREISDYNFKVDEVFILWPIILTVCFDNFFKFWQILEGELRYPVSTCISTEFYLKKLNSWITWSKDFNLKEFNSAFFIYPPQGTNFLSLPTEGWFNYLQLWNKLYKWILDTINLIVNCLHTIQR